MQIFCADRRIYMKYSFTRRTCLNIKLDAIIIHHIKMIIILPSQPLHIKQNHQLPSNSGAVTTIYKPRKLPPIREFTTNTV
jgi:hypothetical protein